MNSIVYAFYSQLPMMLNADQVAAALNSSRTNTYVMMYSKGARQYKSASAWRRIGIS